MRLWFMPAAAMLIGLGGCASSHAERTATAVGGSFKMAGRGLGAAVTAPLADFNLTREDIPPVLVKAAEDPYREPERVDCPALEWEVAQLDRELGPDVDMPDTDGDYYTQGSEAAADAALDAVRDVTTGWIPFRSAVRRMTGAEKHASTARKAVHAGLIRRAYLKGYGKIHGCSGQAAPVRYAKKTDPAVKDGSAKPKTQVQVEKVALEAQAVAAESAQPVLSAPAQSLAVNEQPAPLVAAEALVLTPAPTPASSGQILITPQPVEYAWPEPTREELIRAGAQAGADSSR